MITLFDRSSVLMYDEERLVITDRKKTPEGFLDVGGVFSRIGIQLYTRKEAGFDGDPNATVRLYRPPEEVFDKASIDSMVMKPVTDDHPPELVDTKNIKKYSVGMTGSEITHDQQNVRGRMVITDDNVIKKVEGGTVEISVGYTTELDRTPGTAPNGEKYDGIQRVIRGNHIAIVDAGRCGSECRINDSACCASCAEKEKSAMTDKPNQPLSQVTVDSLSVEAAGNGAQIIQKAISDRDVKIADLEKQLADEKTARTTEVKEITAAKDKAEAERDDLKTKIPDAAALDTLVAERTEVVTAAKQIAGDSIKTEGVALSDIRKQAVEAKCGGDAIKDKSDDYIAARFDALKEGAGAGDPIADAYKSAPTRGAEQADPKQAYGDMRSGLNDAWKRPESQKAH